MIRRPPISPLFPYTTLFRSYDKGHMTPVGDFGDTAEENDTFSLANMVPQTPALNEGIWAEIAGPYRSEEHTSELQSHVNLVCRLLLEKKKTNLVPRCDSYLF